MEAIQIKHMLAPGLHDSSKYCAAFCRSDSLSAIEDKINAFNCTTEVVIKNDITKRQVQ